MLVRIVRRADPQTRRMGFSRRFFKHLRASIALNHPGTAVSLPVAAFWHLFYFLPTISERNVRGWSPDKNAVWQIGGLLSRCAYHFGGKLMAALYQRFTGKINTNRSFPAPPEASHLLGGNRADEDGARPNSGPSQSDRPRLPNRRRGEHEDEDVRQINVLLLLTPGILCLQIGGVVLWFTLRISCASSCDVHITQSIACVVFTCSAACKEFLLHLGAL